MGAMRYKYKMLLAITTDDSVVQRNEIYIMNFISWEPFSPLMLGKERWSKIPSISLS